MSRIGKLPIAISENVDVVIDALNVKVKGPKGALNKSFSGQIDITLSEKGVVVTPLNQEKQSRAMWGTARSIINNMVQGVTVGFKEELEVKGVGYRASVKGSYLCLILGKSHNTVVEIPQNIQVKTPKQDLIALESIDKEALGQFIAMVKDQRPPEPYKGKGIYRKGEYVFRKVGKKS